MKRRITDPKSPLWPIGILLILLVGVYRWPRTLWRRKRGPKLMSKRESLSERYKRLGYMEDNMAGGTESPRRLSA